MLAYLHPTRTCHGLMGKRAIRFLIDRGQPSKFLGKATGQGTADTWSLIATTAHKLREPQVLTIRPQARHRITGSQGHLSSAARITVHHDFPTEMAPVRLDLGERPPRYPDLHDVRPSDMVNLQVLSCRIRDWRMLR